MIFQGREKPALNKRVARASGVTHEVATLPPHIHKKQTIARSPMLFQYTNWTENLGTYQGSWDGKTTWVIQVDLLRLIHVFLRVAG